MNESFGVVRKQGNSVISTFSDINSFLILTFLPPRKKISRFYPISAESYWVVPDEPWQVAKRAASRQAFLSLLLARFLPVLIDEVGRMQWPALKWWQSLLWSDPSSVRTISRNKYFRTRACWPMCAQKWSI